MLESAEAVILLLTMLTIVSGILYILALWTEFGQKKGFRFLTGNFCMITTVVYSFQLARDPTKFSCTMVIVYFLLTLIIFALATWFGEK